jgi:hypothetical protein
MFPVFMKKKGDAPPEVASHYIIAKNGVFLKKGNWWMDAVVPVKQIAVLEEQSIKLALKIKPITSVVLTKAWRFFQAIYEKHHSESAVLLHYSEKLGWELTVPKQSATFAHVDYEMTDRITGYSLIGTMHSHSSMSAFHSGTDIGDEAQVDGVHITFGDLNEAERFSLDPEVVVNGTRFVLPPEYMEGMKQVTEGTDSKLFRAAQPPKFTIECPDLKDWKTPDEWIAKVEKKSYTAFDWKTIVGATTSIAGVGKKPTLAQNGELLPGEVAI